MIGGMILLMTTLVLIALSGELFGQIHLHLVSLMGLAAIEHRMLALMVALSKHTKCWRVSAGAMVWRGCVVGVKS